MNAAVANDFAEASVRENDLQFRRLLDKLPSAAYTCDADGHITYFNQLAADTWQREPRLNDPRERFCGSFKLFAADGMAIAHDECWMARAILEGKAFNGREIVIQRPDGSRRIVLAHASPFHDCAGRLTGGVNILVDVTQGRELEERLDQAKRGEALGKLVGGMAHEFNHIFTVMGAYAELALSTLDTTDPNHGMLVEIERSVKKAALLTSQLLAFGRKQILQPRLVNADDVVAKAGSRIRQIIGEGIQVKYSLGSPTCLVTVDPERFEQAVTNLVHQASVSMLPAGVVTVKTRQVCFSEAGCGQSPGLAPGHFFALTVTDAGLASTTDAGHAAAGGGDSLARGAEATGPAVATVKEFVQQAGGFTRVSTEPSVGNTFTIYLPAAEPARKLVQAPPRGNDALAGTETILVVDDEAMVRSVIRHALTSYGYRVLEAANGVEALRVVQEHDRIDLVLSDVMMPEMGGYQLVEKLSQIRPSLKVMFVSGYNQDAQMRQSVSQRQSVLIHKPFSPVALVRAVREMLNASPAAANA